MSTHENLSRESNPAAWSKTTTGVVVTLIATQFLTGTFLAFYYVPSVDHAHTTVLFIEKVLSSGSWLRSVHHYGSQWLALFAFVHVVRLFWQKAYRECRGLWLSSVLLLAFVMGAGATGYSLPWDARAFFSTRVAEGLLSGLPFVGQMSRLWLLGGNEISTLTLSRFFALHVLVTPFLILFVLTWRIRSAQPVSRLNLTRQAIVGGLVFLALSLWALKYPAPLGPSVIEAGADYLPRPGAQFLWLYQTLKYVPGGIGSIVGVVLPAVGLFLLFALPWLKKIPQRALGGTVIGIFALLIVSMSFAAYLSDRSDARTRDQLARQAAQERLVRSQPFEPARLNPRLDRSNQTTSSAIGDQAPAAYLRFCANCHGPKGEGARQGELRFPPLLGVAQKPRRTIDDIVGLLNDPQSYGLQPPMRSFSTKLTDQEKREIAEWVVKLK